MKGEYFCVGGCNATNPFLYNDYCVNSCITPNILANQSDGAYFLNYTNKVCIKNCNEYTYNGTTSLTVKTEKICTPWCFAPQAFINGQVCQSTCNPELVDSQTNLTCLNQCNASLFIENISNENYCVPFCVTPYPYSNGIDCVKNCSSFDLFVNGTVCISECPRYYEQQESENVCIGQCPGYVNITECISFCPYFYNNYGVR